jgi:hypothetical protein
MRIPPQVIQSFSGTALLLLIHSTNPSYSLSHKTAVPTAFLLNVSNAPSLKTCRVTNPRGAKVYIEETGRNVRLRTGTPLSLISPRQHQGLIAVRVRQGKRYVRCEIDVGDTNCVGR